VTTTNTLRRPAGIRRRPLTGFATTALCLIVGVSLLAGCTKAKSAAAKAAKGRDVSTLNLKVGQCILPPTKVQPEIEKVKVLLCAQPHTQEAFAVVKYTDTSKGTDYPGDKALRDFADGACLNRYQAYVGVAYSDSTLFYTYLLPSPRSWSDTDDRSVVCLVTTTGERLKTSVKGSGR